MKKNSGKKYIPSKEILKKSSIKEKEKEPSKNEIEKDSSEKKSYYILSKDGSTSTEAKLLFKSLKSKKRKKFIIKLSVIISIMLVILFIAWRILGLVFKYQYKEIDKTDIGIDEEIFQPGEPDKITNIALLGVDANDVSDAIIIASINPNKEVPTIKLVSIARDTLMPIYLKGNKKSYSTKVNEAFGHGGAETMLRTLNKNLRLNVKDFISIKMHGLAVIINKLNGIPMTISKQEQNQINGIINTTPDLKKISKEHVKSCGKVHLNGAQAVAYARIRKIPTLDGVNDDFGRCDRQKRVLYAVFDKVIHTAKSSILGIIEPCLKFTTTSYTLTEAIKLCKNIMDRKYKIEQTTIPNENMPSNTVNRDYKIYSREGIEKSTVLYDLQYAGKLINAFIYEDIAPKDFIAANAPPALSAPKISKPQANRNFNKQAKKEFIPPFIKNSRQPKIENKDNITYPNSQKFEAEKENKLNNKQSEIKNNNKNITKNEKLNSNIMSNNENENFFRNRENIGNSRYPQNVNSQNNKNPEINRLNPQNSRNSETNRLNPQNNKNPEINRINPQNNKNSKTNNINPQNNKNSETNNINAQNNKNSETNNINAQNNKNKPPKTNS